METWSKIWANLVDRVCLHRRIDQLGNELAPEILRIGWSIKRERFDLSLVRIPPRRTSWLPQQAPFSLRPRNPARHRWVIADHREVLRQTSSCPTSAMNAWTSYPSSINQARMHEVSSSTINKSHKMTALRKDTTYRGLQSKQEERVLLKPTFWKY